MLYSAAKKHKGWMHNTVTLVNDTVIVCLKVARRVDLLFRRGKKPISMYKDDVVNLIMGIILQYVHNKPLCCTPKTNTVLCRLHVNFFKK